MSNSGGYRNKMPCVYDIKNFFHHELGYKMVHQLKATNEYVDLITIQYSVALPIKVIKVSKFDSAQYSRSKPFNESYARLCEYLDMTELEEALLFVKLRTKGYFVYKVQYEGNDKYSVSHMGRMETEINEWRKGVC